MPATRTRDLLGESSKKKNVDNNAGKMRRTTMMLTSFIVLLSLVNIEFGQSCREGQMWKDDPGVCQICPTGYYQQENGVKPTSCQSCPAGFYGNAPHASQCTECSAAKTLSQFLS